MKSHKFKLNIIEENKDFIEKDFIFIIPPLNKKYYVHSFLIEKISTKIKCLKLCDKNLQKYKLQTNDPKDYFQNFIDELYGQKNHFFSPNEFIYKFAIELECNELIFKYNEYFIDLYRKNVQYTSSIIPLQIISLRMNYYLSKPQILNNISLEKLDIIFFYIDYLQISTLDLFNWILEMCKNFPNIPYYILFSHIKFENLSLTEIQNFFQLNLNNIISGSLWFNLISKLKTNSMPSKYISIKLETKILSFPYQNQPFNGIFKYFISNFSQNNLPIKLSSGGNKQHQLFNLFIYNDNNKWWENSSPNKGIFYENDQYILIIFTDHSIQLTNYTFRHSLNGKNKGQPKSWIIYGSNDHKEWSILDEVNNALELNVSNGFSTYNCTKNLNSFSIIKIVQKDNFKISSLKYQFKFTLEAIEFFGNLSEK